eukprot:6190451-Pleurochrysis_carterae.AAC.1
MEIIRGLKPACSSCDNSCTDCDRGGAGGQAPMGAEDRLPNAHTPSSWTSATGHDTVRASHSPRRRSILSITCSHVGTFCFAHANTARKRAL